jgi:hypothetical protein
MIQVKVYNKKISAPSLVSVVEFDSIEDAELYASQNRDEIHHSMVSVTK